MAVDTGVVEKVGVEAGVVGAEVGAPGAPIPPELMLQTSASPIGTRMAQTLQATMVAAPVAML